MATLIVPPQLSSPRDDAMQLYKAFKGLGCDTSAVINILAHRDLTQRALIENEYNYTKLCTPNPSPNASLQSLSAIPRYTQSNSFSPNPSFLQTPTETVPNHSTSSSPNLSFLQWFQKAVLIWMPDPARRDAMILRDALSTDIDLKAATEVICSRTPSQLQHLKQLYHSLFGENLEHAVQTHTFGNHGKLLLAYLSTPRSEGLEVDRTMVDYDAKALFKAGEKRLGTDENTFTNIFSSRSRAHIAALSSAYHNTYGNTLKKAVKRETTAFFEDGLVAILQCAENPAKYFAKVLRKAMKGLGTRDRTLIRVIVTRVEIDMQLIKAEYYKKHQKSLNDAVHSETSGHYRAFLLSLLGPNHH